MTPSDEWMQKIEELVENIHTRDKLRSLEVDQMRDEIKMLKASVETQRVTISILCGRARNSGN